MRDMSIAADRRGQTAAAAGLGVQLIAVGALLVLGFWSGSPAVLAGARYLLGGVLIWFVLVLIYTQRKRASLKDREVEELKRMRATDPSMAIFELEEGTVERRRLDWMYRWLFLFTTVLLAAYHILGALYVKWSWSIGESIASDVWKFDADTGPIMAFLAGVGFVCFLYSRYTAGMSHHPEWRLLRAGSSYLAGNALACLALVISMGLRNFDLTPGEPIVAHGIRILMLVLGVEFLIALVLNYYRPRVPGEVSRPAFDSRLLEMISEPGGVARSIADAVNYQFGFEVTKTWFGQLIRRAFFPLVVLGLLVLLLSSSVVIVEAEEQAFVEHFGRLTQPTDRPLEPGVYLKWPWPIERVYRAPVQRLHSAMVGERPIEEPVDEEGRLRPVLWGTEHRFTSEMLTIVASPPQTEYDRIREAARGDVPDDARDKSVAVNLMFISVPMEYRVKDLHDYLYGYTDPGKVLEVLAFRALSDYAAGVDIDHLMGPGRAEFAERFRVELQGEIDALDPPLGIEITFLALQDAHPPSTDGVAKSFQDVITAEVRKNADIETAEGESRQQLTLTAGDVARAEALVEAITRRDRLAEDRGASAEAREEAERDVADLLLGNPARDIPRMSGEAAMKIADAQAARTISVSDAESKARLFEAEVTAYQAAPSLYKVRKYLEMLQRSLELVRKYVVTLDTRKTKLIVIFESEKRDVFSIAEEETRK